MTMTNCSSLFSSLLVILNKKNHDDTASHLGMLVQVLDQDERAVPRPALLSLPSGEVDGSRRCVHDAQARLLPPGSLVDKIKNSKKKRIVSSITEERKNSMGRGEGAEAHIITPLYLHPS